jgi:hypothetical protein
MFAATSRGGIRAEGGTCRYAVAPLLPGRPMPLLRTLRQTGGLGTQPVANAPYRPLPVLRVSGLPGPLAGVFNRPGPCGWFQATALR